MSAYHLITEKVVGAADGTHWAQDHIFLPEDKQKKLKYGDLLTSLSLKAKQERIEVTSFGKEIISRFHEIYYSSSEEDLLKRLKLAAQKLLTEFSEQVVLEIAAAVVIKKEDQLVGYFVLFGQGKIMILREGQLVAILQKSSEEIKTASGFLKDNDLLVLGTSQFFETVSKEDLQSTLTGGQLTEIVDSLAALVHAQEENSQTAAVIFKVELKKSLLEEKKIEEKPELEVSPPKQEKPRKNFLKPLFLLIKNLPSLIQKFIRDFKKQPSVFLKNQERQKRAKRTTLTVAFVLIVLLIMSVILGSRKKLVLQESEDLKQIISEAEYKYDQAVSLNEINPLRSRSLLNEVNEMLSQTETKSKKEAEIVEELLRKVKEKLEEVAREYKLESAEVFLDLGLVKEGFKGTDWGAEEGVLQVLDKEKNTVLEVEVETKAAKVSAGGEKLSQSLKIGFSQARIFILKADKLIVLDAAKGEVIDEREAEEWGEIVDLVAFSGNAYLLDVGKGKILKYLKSDTGLTSAQDYLKAESLNFQGGMSMAIDGSVWVLFSDGTIVKFTRGIKDAFSASGLDKDFEEPAIIYTDSELNNLYILDRKNTRIVLINKETGEYQAQYFWPGLAGALDLFASEKEGKILLLTGERIYQIPLRD